MEEFMDQFLGRPVDSEQPAFIEARKAYDSGDFESALKAWPYNFADQRRALKALMENGGNKRKASNVIDKHLKKFFISAFQSDIFNQVLAARMPGIDKLLTGDMAYKHVNGAMFKVEDASIEQGRCDSFEISPTGPLIGKSMKPLDGPAGQVENPVIASAELNDRDLDQVDNYARGGRRPLRFQPRNFNVNTGRDDLGDSLELAFDLDSGSYATTLLREITKTDIV
jgi:tRNA pseudouridine13 synthase